ILHYATDRPIQTTRTTALFNETCADSLQAQLVRSQPRPLCCRRAPKRYSQGPFWPFTARSLLECWFGTIECAGERVGLTAFLYKRMRDYCIGIISPGE